MSHSPGPDGQVPHALNEVNDRIRSLMDEPASTERAERYRRLLSLWTALSRDDVTKAA
ncbi:MULTISPECIES: hypothetical protein [Streptomyces]|uniref:hypothetical protein n=1 Tax=Streptomyces TaxID=1883 RepID=UPI001BB0C851|nr:MULTISPECIES: hypothetical protein [Streptomyces]MCX4458702.1 hypothetical protein [Streptomyces sp. NBC_01719]MCX4498059.1 hypothetical protein [Streptomyces sp. NBC_01728]QUW78261.1 hypothetical protein SMIR_03115 [Streptomyces mirabilis]